MGRRACRSRYQHPESLACERGLGASNWSYWDACCKVRLPATGERGHRSLGPVGPGGSGWRKGPRFTCQQLETPACVCFSQ